MLEFIISSAMAEEATKAAAQNPNPIMQFAPFILVFVIFYFLMLRPQKKKMEEEKQLLESLKAGDEVYTKSGIIGEIKGLTNKIATIETTEGVKIKILRSQIGGLAKTIFGQENNTAKS
ncbi:MAG: preprotein translocase subunit YajC [Halobacteriovoraceae bacterium]|nr:preprotein translocase subunit YajC [Halobacteriovoraceae bacterium]